MPCLHWRSTNDKFSAEEEDVNHVVTEEKEFYFKATY
jgi:hypothetical protein